MALPVQSVRAAPEHRELLRSVAGILRSGGAERVRRALLDEPPSAVGPFKDEAAAIAFLRDRLVASLRPRMVWLFGSRARGDARPDSDFDLLVVRTDGLPPSAYSPAAVAEPLVACGLPLDVVACSVSQFERDRDNNTGLIGRIAREGRLLYERQDPSP